MPEHQVAEDRNRVPTVPCLTHGAREERWRSLTACATRGAWTTKGQKGLRRCEVAKPPAMALSLAGSASAGTRTRQNLSGKKNHQALARPGAGHEARSLLAPAMARHGRPGGSTRVAGAVRPM